MEDGDVETIHGEEAQEMRITDDGTGAVRCFRLRA